MRDARERQRGRGAVVDRVPLAAFGRLVVAVAVGVERIAEAVVVDVREDDRSGRRACQRQPAVDVDSRTVLHLDDDPGLNRQVDAFDHSRVGEQGVRDVVEACERALPQGCVGGDLLAVDAERAQSGTGQRVAAHGRIGLKRDRDRCLAHVGERVAGDLRRAAADHADAHVHVAERRVRHVHVGPDHRDGTAVVVIPAVALGRVVVERAADAVGGELHDGVVDRSGRTFVERDAFPVADARRAVVAVALGVERAAVHVVAHRREHDQEPPLCP